MRHVSDVFGLAFLGIANGAIELVTIYVTQMLTLGEISTTILTTLHVNIQGHGKMDMAMYSIRM